MTITGHQIREARRLLRRSTARLSRGSGIGFDIVLRTQVDAEIGSVDPEAVRTLRRAFERAGVDFTPNGVCLCRRKPLSLTPGRSVSARA